MTATVPSPVEILHDRSPFAGTDVCAEAGLTLPDAVRRPLFENDLWDFTDVAGLPVQMSKVSRRFDFSPIGDHRWRLVAKVVFDCGLRFCMFQ